MYLKSPQQTLEICSIFILLSVKSFTFDFLKADFWHFLSHGLIRSDQKDAYKIHIISEYPIANLQQLLLYLSKGWARSDLWDTARPSKDFIRRGVMV